MWRLTAFLVCLLSLALNGCVAVGTGQVVGRYVGFVEVLEPAPVAGTAAGVRQTRVRTLGGWLEVSPGVGGVESLGAGWRSSQRLIVPKDCRLVIIVRSEAEMASVKTLLSLEGVAKGEQCLLKDAG